MNQVDTSQETIEREWARIEAEYSVITEPKPETTGENEQAGEGEYIGKEYSPEEIAAMQSTMTEFIAGGVGMAFGVMNIDYVDEKHVTKFAGAWAVVVVKRWPENPIAGFYEEYGDLIAAGSATLVLIGAIRKGKQVDKDKVKEAVKTELAKGAKGAESGN